MEEELVKKAQNGEADAFGRLYDTYLPKIYRFVFIKVSRKQDAEDITHQVFLSAWQNIQTFRFQGFPFSSWLYKIAWNAVIDHYRTKKPEENIEFVAEDALSESSEFIKEIEIDFEIRIVKRELLKLEDDQQNVLIMKFVNELTNKEIAGVLGKSEGAIRVIQHRALKQLKKQINESRIN